MSSSDPSYIPEPRYVTYRSKALKGYIVADCAGAYRGCPASLADMFRTQGAAQHALARLNAGTARIDSHAIIGCRVVQS